MAAVLLWGEGIRWGRRGVKKEKRESRSPGFSKAACLSTLYPMHGSLQPWDKIVLSLPGHQVSAQGRDRAKQWDEGAVLSVNQGAGCCCSGFQRQKAAPLLWVHRSPQHLGFPSSLFPTTQTSCIFVGDFSVSQVRVALMFPGTGNWYHERC